MMITVAIEYEVITQLMSSMLTPRLPAISLIATFTMEVSINSITAAETVVITIINFAIPFADMIYYFVGTETYALRPARKIFLYVLISLIAIFTGTRCVTFTKFPLALSGGSKENFAPVASLKLST